MSADDVRQSGLTAFRDFVIDGVPGSGPNNPAKDEIRTFVNATADEFEALLLSFTGGYVIKETKANLFADLAHPAGAFALVIHDNTSPNGNGYYKKSGSSGSGSWSFVTVDPAEAARAATATLAAAAAASAAAAAAALATFNTVFALTDTTTGKLIRIKVTDEDGVLRVLADADEDVAGVGLTFYAPVRVPDGNWPLASLDEDVTDKLLPSAHPTTSGYLYRILDAEDRILFGIPENAGLPISAYVTRAATADNAAGGVTVSANETYVVEVFDDEDGVAQIRSLTRQGANRVVLTSGDSPATGPLILSDDKVIFTREEAAYYVEASGGPVWPIKATPDLSVIGDSLSDDGSGYLGAIGVALPGRTVHDCAEGGERTEGIAVSFGAEGLLTLAVSGNALPTSGTAACVPNITFLPGSGTNSVTADVISAAGDVIPCRIICSSGTYAIRPETYPGAPIALANPAPATVSSLTASGTADPSAATALSVVQQGVALIRVGKNNYKNSYDLADIRAKTAAIVAAVRPLAKAFLVAGVTNGYSDLPVAMGGTAASESESKTWLDRQEAITAAFAEDYPDNFVDLQANHVALGGSSNHTIMGQVRAVLNSSVLSDGVHENATGQTRSATAMAAAATARSF